MTNTNNEYVVTMTSPGGNVEVLGWGATAAEAIEHAIDVLNRGGNQLDELPDNCSVHPATIDLTAALDDDEDAPWFVVDNVFDLDFTALAERETEEA